MVITIKPSRSAKGLFVVRATIQVLDLASGRLRSENLYTSHDVSERKAKKIAAELPSMRLQYMAGPSLP